MRTQMGTASSAKGTTSVCVCVCVSTGCGCVCMCARRATRGRPGVQISNHGRARAARGPPPSISPARPSPSPLLAPPRFSCLGPRQDSARCAARAARCVRRSPPRVGTPAGGRGAEPPEMHLPHRAPPHHPPAPPEPLQVLTKVLDMSGKVARARMLPAHLAETVRGADVDAIVAHAALHGQFWGWGRAKGARACVCIPSVLPCAALDHPRAAPPLLQTLRRRLRLSRQRRRSSRRSARCSRTRSKATR